MSPDPVLYVLAGPNGAGKTTFVKYVLIPEMHLRFVNAAQLAAAQRAELHRCADVVHH